MSELYLGLMSGTSMDGIDAALVQFGDRSILSLVTLEHEYPADLRRQLQAAIHRPDIRHASDVADLHKRVGECFRDAANALLASAGIAPGNVRAIGSHGQTVRHAPEASPPYSLQIGDPALIATGTGIPTVADFRSADIAAGGQGAPLAPAFHEWLLRRSGTTRVVVNVGGIANLTILPAMDDAATTGFDSGPGNTLMDAWCQRHRGEAFDRDGTWAAAGAVNGDLLNRLLADPYLAAPPPKSTGFEYFNLDWLTAAGVDGLQAADVQSTLCELTSRSIADAVQRYAEPQCEVLVCGGGVHNAELMRRLRAALPGHPVASTSAAGLDPDWVEAAAFAWLAKRRLDEEPGNLPAVTGARQPALLGEIFAVSQR